MGDQPTNNVNNDTDAPAGAFKSQSPTHGVTAVASSAPNEARAPLTPTGESLEKTPGQLLKEIRKDLDELWEAQRGSIIAAIKIEKLDQAYEHTRKQRQEILGRIRSNAEKFWLQTGQVKEWIRELTREEDGRLLDHKHKFSVVEDGHEPKKFDDLCRWLERQGLADRPGCYCFKKEDEMVDKYVYIGRATVLRDRIKEHEKARYFTYSNAIRIVIPRNKQKLEELERLLILAHPAPENQKAGDLGGTPLDNLLDFLEREVRELTEDAPGGELS